MSEFSNLMENVSSVNGDELKSDLSTNKHLQKDLKTIFSCITPYIPMISLLSGGIIIAKHFYSANNNKIIGRRAEKEEE